VSGHHMVGGAAGERGTLWVAAYTLSPSNKVAHAARGTTKG
jgi:hypothetical protein